MWRIDPGNGRPIYEQLIDCLRRALASGAMRPGDKLPSVRQLAGDVRANPNTVARAYREMEGMGLIQTLQGKGVYVAEGFKTGTESAARKRLRDLFAQAVREARLSGLDEAEIQAMLTDAWKEDGQ